MSFRLGNKAEDDIAGIAKTGLLLFGTEQARRYHAELFDLFELIAANPRMARERREIEPPVRIQPFKAHLVVYEVDDHDDVVILRVRHGHENWSET